VESLKQQQEHYLQELSRQNTQEQEIRAKLHEIQLQNVMLRSEKEELTQKMSSEMHALQLKFVL
jgi:hypothetical protein